MKSIRLVCLLLMGILAPFVALSTSAALAGDNADQPNLLSFGMGSYDIDKNDPRVKAIDFRFEDRWGTSLLPLIDSDLSSWNEWFQIHPFAGMETTSRAQLYGFGGLVFDVLLGRHVVLSPSFAAGLYDAGNGKKLGSIVEFRSTLEAGYRFDNDMRVTGFLSHTSNAGLTRLNSGEETLGMYLHVPFMMIFGNQ